MLSEQEKIYCGQYLLDPRNKSLHKINYNLIFTCGWRVNWISLSFGMNLSAIPISNGKNPFVDSFSLVFYPK